VAHPIKPLADLAENRQPGTAVILGEIDVFTPITTTGDVIKTSGQFDSQGSRHEVILASKDAL
jgi:hypothetical protein